MEGWWCLMLLPLLSTSLMLSSGEMTENDDDRLVSFLKNVFPELLERDEPIIFGHDFGVNSLKDQEGSEEALFKLPFKPKAVNQATNGASGPVVSTKDGQIQGLTTEKANIFYGIPYADPPVGAYRWKPPRPVSAWQGLYDASYPRAACMQICTGQITEECPRTVSEDCLYLNIFVPLDVDFSSHVKNLLPVMVWIHGGDFIAGTASKSLYDGRFFSNFTHTVVVSIEYRLGAFGFLVSGKESQTSAVGNYGILDQQAALLWVQRNIAVFGGDPSKVTIFGESAGAQSVSLHLMIQSSQPLFRQAILQSLPFSIPLKTRHDALKLGKEFAEQTNCSVSDIVCLLSLSAQAILRAQMKTSAKIRNPFRFLEAFETWGPHIDGEFIKEQAVTAFLKGHWQKEKSVLLGTTSEEGVLFAYAIFQKPVSAVESTVYIAAIFKQHTLRILHTYLPLYRDTDHRNMLAQIITDYVFLCPSRKSARVGTTAGSEVWMYEFDHVASDHRVWSGLTFCYQHACHGAELPFLFDSASVTNFTLTLAEKLLSNRMLCYWGAFAHTGDPSSRVHQTPFCREQRLPVWPRYSDTSGWLFMNLTVHSHAQVGTREHICDFWDQLSIYE
ncbi:cholinesterase 1 [Gouania willdenowi]|uniref:cholinesterase 1 n=1 Tax=Gouania willdenowi TaxID=441366 RepID=UPI001055F1AB|nr:cholinesterase 1-like [Gouania willdenowi]